MEISILWSLLNAFPTKYAALAVAQMASRKLASPAAGLLQQIKKMNIVNILSNYLANGLTGARCGPCSHLCKNKIVVQWSCIDEFLLYLQVGWRHSLKRKFSSSVVMTEMLLELFNGQTLPSCGLLVQQVGENKVMRKDTRIKQMVMWECGNVKTIGMCQSGGISSRWKRIQIL